MENGIALRRQDFGEDFIWGAASSSYQIEGGYNADYKGLSIWDEFSKKNRIAGKHNGNVACNFYRTYEKDLELMRSMNIQNFRFSISWPRVMPTGQYPVNEKGIDFYDRLVDKCLELGITPWATLYHWDLPQELQNKGGWVNRHIIDWFRDYTKVCVKRLGDRVKNWMVLNEPMVFTGAGYFLGQHAPGKIGLTNFLPAMHHAAICQADGAKVIRLFCPDAYIGTTMSFSHIDPLENHFKHLLAASRMDALLNRMFLEPYMGLGYPINDLGFLQQVEKFFYPNDDYLIKFPFDFIGIQVYTRQVVKYAPFIPYLRSSIVNALKRNVPHTQMEWEVYPKSIYHILKKLDAYNHNVDLIVTENGAAFNDQLDEGQVNDENRVHYLKSYIEQMLQAKREGVNVKGYFVWSFMDNLEWAEGYYPRFGLVYVDYKSQRRYIKDSGKWYTEFLT